MIGERGRIKAGAGRQTMKVSFGGWVLGGALLVSTASAVAQGKSASEDLLSAIRNGADAELVQLVEAKGKAIVNIRGFDGSTALTLAIAKRRLSYVQFLLDNGADPETANRDGEVPMTLAARLGWLDGVNLLLAGKAKADSTNRLGETALIIAVQGRNLPLVRRLLDAGADPDKADRASGRSARDYARQDSRVRDLARLIDSRKPRP